MYKIQGSNWRAVIHDSWSIFIISQNTFSKFSRNSRITNHFLIARYGSNIIIQYRFKQWAAQQKHFICLLYLPDIYPRSGVGALAMKVRLALHLHLNLLWLRSLPYFHSAYQWTGFYMMTASVLKGLSTMILWAATIYTNEFILTPFALFI